MRGEPTVIDYKKLALGKISGRISMTERIGNAWFQWVSATFIIFWHRLNLFKITFDHHENILLCDALRRRMCGEFRTNSVADSSCFHAEKRHCSYLQMLASKRWVGSFCNLEHASTRCFPTRANSRSVKVLPEIGLKTTSNGI